MDGIDRMDGMGSMVDGMDRANECAGAKNFAALRIAAAATKRRRKGCCGLNIPLTSISMRRRRWREECHDFDMSSCSAALSERANREIGDGEVRRQ